MKTSFTVVFWSSLDSTGSYVRVIAVRSLLLLFSHLRLVDD